MNVLAGVVGMMFMVTFLLCIPDAIAGLLVGEVEAPAVFVAIGLFCFLVAWLNR